MLNNIIRGGRINMGLFRDKAQELKSKASKQYDEFMELEEGAVGKDDFNDVADNFDDDFKDDYSVNIQPAQKPESFHHFLLENQFRDIELVIRGYKQVFNKDTNKWETKRNKQHCFTDEEAEHILRTAQTHLSTDIKLSYISIANFPVMMLTLKEQLEDYFYTIADDKYGRYGHSTNQKFMKQDNHNIFVMLMSRIQANYSRAIQGQENKHTHNAVKGQESLSNSGSGSDLGGDRGYY